MNIIDTIAINQVLIDYKSDVYGISIGGNYSLSAEKIEWNWDVNSDPDGKDDSIGYNSYFYMGEPLIVYNGEGWLPALFIQTSNNIIQSFTCSLLFELGADSVATESFLAAMSQSIKQLKNLEVIDSIKTKGYFRKKTNDCVERIELFETENGYYLFEYSVKSN